MGYAMIFKKWVTDLFKDGEYKKFIGLYDDRKLIRINNLFGSSNIFFLANLFRDKNSSILYLTGTDEEARNSIYDFESAGIEKAYYFPSCGTTPYQYSMIDEETSSKRLEVLKHLLKNENCIVCASVEAVFFNIIPKEKIAPFIFTLTKNDRIALELLSKKLIQSGYFRVAQVSEPGEFSIRGEIVDIFYSSLKNPVRIEFFDDQIESIRSFNVLSQKSEEIIEEIVIPPHKEILYGEKEAEIAGERIKTIAGSDDEKNGIIEKISNFQIFDGEQYYLRLFYEKYSLCNYFEDGILAVNDFDLVSKKAESMFREFNENYHITNNLKKPRFEVSEMLFNINEVYGIPAKIIECNYFEDSVNVCDLKFDYKGIPVYLGNLEIFKNDLKKYLDQDYRVVIFAVNDIQTNRYQALFSQFDPSNDVFDFSKKGFSILPLFLTSGFVSDEKKILFLSDYEIFGKRKSISKHFYTKRAHVIDSFLDLKPGDYVVHIHHGIGQFAGIERVKSLGNEKDYIAILYAEGDKIFIPVEQLNFVQKYISGEVGKPKLDRIGTKGWSKTKERVRKSIEELAGELVKLYSFRLSQKGFAFSPDTPWQKEFEAKFPYEETEDQLLAIEEVKRDMESQRPMDRLICGDVGFGKTEVAMRAAFKAVMSGKQTVILVPTTILAEQHYENFSERFKDYPIKIEMLSRFRTPEEQKEILKKLSEGDVDIIIGTHRLLSNDVIFKNPGLLIIDEEHRFGVKHKEKIKQFRKTMDCLTMTATPIPRTLHMSLAKIRDMSTINTPPKERLPVETYVAEFSDDLFKVAAKRELERKGQIFFLYNRISTIYEMKMYIQKLLPEAKIIVAHGRMHEDDLEDIIHQFVNYKFDILLTTTIIESGIDIPRANTIFIDRADRFGLAQLYQLRGRVGRSNVKAYAYLFHEPNVSLTEDAMKRLRVISEYTELGSGFKIAMKDLEIRGAGNLLGPEQSGDILAVGFQLYCKLLSEAIKEINKKEDNILELEEENEVYLELQYSGYIPDSYISDPKQKIDVYKRIAGVIHEEEVKELKSTLSDRFGKIPPEVEILFYLSEIRIICKDINITEVIEKSRQIEIILGDSAKIDFERLMTLIAQKQGAVFLLGKKPNSIFVKVDEELGFKEKGEYLKGILKFIMKK
jgi:transcription-repair coupling factor (superfamily II helicase)